MRTLFGLIVALILTACASSGENFSEQSIDQLKPGMTEQQVIDILGGTPVSRAYNSDGSYVAVWHYVRVVYVSTTDNKLITLLFDKERSAEIEIEQLPPLVP